MGCKLSRDSSTEEDGSPDRSHSHRSRSNNAADQEQSNRKQNCPSSRKSKTAALSQQTAEQKDAADQALGEHELVGNAHAQPNSPESDSESTQRQKQKTKKKKPKNAAAAAPCDSPSFDKHVSNTGM